jgi:hypothetical protein
MTDKHAPDFPYQVERRANALSKRDKTAYLKASGWFGVGGRKWRRGTDDTAIPLGTATRLQLQADLAAELRE